MDNHYFIKNKVLYKKTYHNSGSGVQWIMRVPYSLDNEKCSRAYMARLREKYKE